MWAGRQAAALGLSGAGRRGRACRRCWRAGTQRPGRRWATAGRPHAGGREGDPGGGGVRCDVLGAEVGEGVVGADRRRRAARRPRRRGARRRGPLERFGATTRVRSNGGRLHPDTAGLTVAAFRQTTSRADDPQLHTHAVISAKVQTDRRSLVGVGRPLPEAPSADAGRPVPVGAARRAHPPLRGRVGADRQRPGRNRRRARRAVGGVLETRRPGRRAPSRPSWPSSGAGRVATRPGGNGPR